MDISIIKIGKKFSRAKLFIGLRKNFSISKEMVFSCMDELEKNGQVNIELETTPEIIQEIEVLFVENNLHIKACIVKENLYKDMSDEQFILKIMGDENLSDYCIDDSSDLMIHKQTKSVCIVEDDYAYERLKSILKRCR